MSNGGSLKREPFKDLAEVVERVRELEVKLAEANKYIEELEARITNQHSEVFSKEEGK